MALQPDEQLAKIAAYIEDMASGRLAVSEKIFRLRLAQKVAGRVSTKYRDYSSSPSTTEASAIRAGKEKGAVRPARPGREPIDVFDLLAKNVRVVRYGDKHYRVQIRPGAVHPAPRPDRGYPGGIPLTLMAHWIENPKPYTISMSLRQLGYLYAIREGRGGIGTRRSKRAHLPDKRTSFVIVFDPPDRPVWRAVAQELNAMADLYYKRPYFSLLKRVGRAYGMI